MQTFDLKKEVDELIKFIETCSDEELDKLLNESQFGSLCDQIDGIDLDKGYMAG